jgi:predicted DNA-binding protein (MmcQ/YjbR family)
MNDKALEKLVGKWPGVTRDIKWGDDLVFSVANKMFVVTAFRGAHTGKLSFKVEDERFLELTDRPGIIPAPYMARNMWVTVLPAKLPRAELEGMIRRSYELVRAKLTKKVQAQLAG